MEFTEIDGDEYKDIELVVNELLPKNYNFEIVKSIARVRRSKPEIVALQFPEGLLMYASRIVGILEQFCGVECVILGDVTYGACCVDDVSAKALGAEFMIHYGHSCLVPIDVTTIEMLYVFVEIGFDIVHLIDSIKLNFDSESSKIALAGTIQFAHSVRLAQKELEEYSTLPIVPQEKPLSRGEVLGCTAPKLDDSIEVVIFVADGRFHMEALMIANPQVREFYRYNPYDKKLTLEEYDHDKMMEMRQNAIDKAVHAEKWGLILGTLGRQGNPNIMERLRTIIMEKGLEYQVILISEITIETLSLFEDIDVWVQIACPRLSIDWGYAFESTPLLTPYEAMVALEKVEWQPVYPMDNYSKNGGEWTNYYGRRDLKKKGNKSKAKAALRERIKAARAAKKHVSIEVESNSSA